LDTTTAIYAGVGLAGCALAILHRLRIPDRSNAKDIQKHPGIAQPSPESARQRQTRSRLSGSVPEVRRPASGGPDFAALEGQLRAAILSADARERLVQHALQTVNGDRAAAIRKVLNDLSSDNKRWS
jgi:hypothetical protein